MKQYMISNAGTIGAMISIALFLLTISLDKYWTDTKYAEPIIILFLAILIIGFGTIGESIGKWIVK